MRYVALLRGINVGGNALIKMADLKTALAKDFNNVTTYIQSGNVIFDSAQTSKLLLADSMQTVISKAFNLHVRCVVFSKTDWQTVIDQAPDWWGQDPGWKHNMLAVIPPIGADTVIEKIGTLKPEIESLQAGHGVVYQSVSWASFGRSTSGKLASNPIYKDLTVRNYNTTTKIQGLLTN